MNDTPSRVGRCLENIPCWLFSAGLHLVLFLGAALVVVEQLHAIELPPLIVKFHEPRPALALEEMPRSVKGSPGSVMEDLPSLPPIDPVLWNPLAETGVPEGLSQEASPSEIDRLQNCFLSDQVRLQDDPRCSWPRRWAGRVESPGARLGGPSTSRFPSRFGKAKDQIVWTCHLRMTESAVDAGLRWLARHQSAYGSWSASGWGHAWSRRTCSGPGVKDYDTGVTALAVLAFLGAGYTQLSRDERVDPAIPGRTLLYGDTVKRALRWLMEHQDSEGSVGERGPKHLYNHAIASLALSEAYGLTSSPPLREPAQKAIDFLVGAQNPGKGWRYQSRSNQNDSSVTGWAVMALKSAELSELSFPKAAYQGALHWLSEATDKSNGYRTGYTEAGTGKVYVPGQNETWSDHPSMSAVAVLSRIMIERKRRAPELDAVNLLVADLPTWSPGQVDFYYWYYASLALFQYDGPDGPVWKKWNEPMKTAIVANQKTKSAGCENGSWDPSADRWGSEGGRVYATAMNALTLEVYYRYCTHFSASPTK